MAKKITASEMGKLSAKKRLAGMTKKQRSEHMRKIGQLGADKIKRAMQALKDLTEEC